MSQPLFNVGTTIQARAFLVGQRIDVKAFDRLDGKDNLAVSPLVVRAGANGYAALFRFGTIVLFNLDWAEEQRFLNDVRGFIKDPFENPESENVTMMVVSGLTDNKLEEGQIKLSTCSTEHLQLVASALAKTVYLAYYEGEIARIYDLIEPMAVELKKRGRTGKSARELLQHIGETLLIQGRMMSRAEVEDKPDFLWEHPHLDRLYMALVNEYELQERLANLKQKLDLIHLTVGTLLDFIQDRRTLHVEWYIVILIVFEICFTMAEKFLS